MTPLVLSTRGGFFLVLGWPAIAKGDGLLAGARRLGALTKHLRPTILNRDANISRPCARMVGVWWFFVSAMARAF